METKFDYAKQIWHLFEEFTKVKPWRKFEFLAWFVTRDPEKDIERDHNLFYIGDNDILTRGYFMLSNWNFNGHYFGTSNQRGEQEKTRDNLLQQLFSLRESYNGNGGDEMESGIDALVKYLGKHDVSLEGIPLGDESVVEEAEYQKLIQAYK